MRDFFKFVIELLVVAIVVALAVTKYDEALTPAIPWLALSISFYVTWNHVLSNGHVQSSLACLAKRSLMAYLCVFFAAGLLGCLYLYGIRKGLAKLNTMETVAKARAEIHPKEGPVKPASPPAPLPPPSIDTNKLAHELAEKLKSQAPKPVARAHVHVTKFEWNVPADAGGRAKVKVFFENDGNAPITKWISCDHAGFYPLMDEGRENQLIFEREFYSNEPSLTMDQLNASENQIPVGVDRSVEITSSPWAQGAIDSFRAGKAVMYVSGTMTYADAHSTHRTSFCGYIGIDGNTRFCQRHNEEM